MFVNKLNIDPLLLFSLAQGTSAWFPNSRISDLPSFVLVSVANVRPTSYGGGWGISGSPVPGPGSRLPKT